MAKIIVGAFVSLDGVMQAPGGPDEDRSGGFELGGWTAPLSDDSVGEVVSELLGGEYDLLLGRKTYDIFAGYWPLEPNSQNAIGRKFNAVTKYVASRNPAAKLNWQHSMPLGRDPVGNLQRIKQGDGPDLVTQGSAEFLQTLFASDLVDEMTLMIYPVLLGKGKRLFRDDIAPATFGLIDSRASSRGVVINRYRRISGTVATGTY